MFTHKYQHITPAILPKSFEDLMSHLKRIEKLVHTVQIDVVDGVFAPNKTWPYVDETDDNFIKIVNQEEGLPYWDSLDFEIDLMVSDPVFAADQWIAAGANRIIVHAKSISKEKLLALARSVREKGVELIVAVEESSVETLKEQIAYIESSEPVEEGVSSDTKKIISGIQCMGILKIGFQHMPAYEGIFNLIAQIKTLYPHIPVSVDGGVTLDNAGPLFDAGADRLVSGSAIFEAPSVEDAVNEFEEIYQN